MHTNILTSEQKIIAKEIFEHLKNEKTQSILMHCHPSPDPDSLGSVLATKYALESIGKKVTIIAGDSELPNAFMHFPGAREILVQNYFETDLTKFDTFLILDSGAPSMVSRKVPVILPPESNPNLKTIVIDHHASNVGYGDINLVALQYMSTTEILFDLFQEWVVLSKLENYPEKSFAFTKEIATNLYVGLFTDSGGFRYERTTDHSFYMASILYEHNPQIIEIVTTLENSASKGSIDFLGLALSQKKVFESDNKKKGSFVISYVSHEDIVRLGLTSDDIASGYVCNILKSVVGWNVLVAMIEEVPNEVKISFRSRDAVQFDVSKVALLLGGGGHKAAAGALVRKPMSEAIDMVAETIKKELFS